VVIFCSGRADLSIYKVCLGEKKMGKFKLLGRPTCRPSACSNAACLGPPVSDPSCPLAPATCHRRIAVAPHASYHRVQDGVGSTRPHHLAPAIKARRHGAVFPFTSPFPPSTSLKKSHPSLVSPVLLHLRPCPSTQSFVSPVRCFVARYWSRNPR
jgi:hypothetical protein